MKAALATAASIAVAFGGWVAFLVIVGVLRL